MESFLYIARDLAEVEKKGIRRGNSEQEVYLWLYKQGLVPIEVRQVASTIKVKGQVFGRKRPKFADMAAFCWQLATMLEGGVIITEALDTISEDIENLSFRYTLVEISDRIKKGESFSESVSKFPKVFNNLFCAMTLAGEASGSLPTVLVRLAEYYDGRDKFIKKVRAALTYPAFVVVFVFIILVIMMTVIIPKFRLIFEQMGSKLPAFTQIFMAGYDILADNIVLIFTLVALLIALLIVYYKTRNGHMRVCSLVLATPLIGKLAAQAFVTTFCRTMSTLLAAGVSIIEAFDILAGMTHNDVIKSAVLRSKEHVIEGSSVSLGLAATGFFPNMVAKMVEVGEQSGSLPKVLNKAGNYYEAKMDATITTLLSLLGPMVIIVVGSIVLVVVVALYMPIFTISDVRM